MDVVWNEAKDSVSQLNDSISTTLGDVVMAVQVKETDHG